MADMVGIRTIPVAEGLSVEGRARRSETCAESDGTRPVRVFVRVEYRTLHALKTSFYVYTGSIIRNGYYYYYYYS